MYKNIEKQTKLNLKDQVDYQPGQVVSKTLVQNEYVSMTIFSFDKGEEISTHAAGGDAMVTVLEGKGRFTVGGEVFFLEDCKRKVDKMYTLFQTVNRMERIRNYWFIRKGKFQLN